MNVNVSGKIMDTVGWRRPRLHSSKALLMPQVVVPAARFASAAHPPRGCVRHGRPAERGLDVGFQSRPRKNYRISHAGAFSMALQVTEHLERIHRVPVRRWPFCAACLRHRARIRLASAVLFFGGLTLAAGAVLIAFVVLSDPEPLLVVPLFTGLVCAVSSGFVFGVSSWSHVARATVSADGQWVVFDQADPRFVAEVTPSEKGGPAPR